MWARDVGIDAHRGYMAPEKAGSGADHVQEASPVILQVKDLRKYFPVRSGFLRRTVGEVKAVDGVSFTVREGETLGLVGESGCGKTTVGRSILRLVEPTAGEVWFQSDLVDASHQGPAGMPRAIDLAQLRQEDLKTVRREIQMIFQDPNSSLNPRMSVYDILREPFQIHGISRARRQMDERIEEIMVSVGLSPEYRFRFPHQFSGGQRQRIGIARALALRPKLIIADEPVSALDVSVQGQVLNLLEALQKEYGLTYVFIAHDLAVVEHISDTVAVMYLGRIVEYAPKKALYATPKHPYTEALLSAVPVADPDYESKRMILEGGVPSPLDPPTGCHFHPRCPYAKQNGRMEICASQVPPLHSLGDEHFVACHFAPELSLTGVTDRSANGYADGTMSSGRSAASNPMSEISIDTVTDPDIDADEEPGVGDTAS